jgi:hypothetical protein
LDASLVGDVAGNSKIDNGVLRGRVASGIEAPDDEEPSTSMEGPGLLVELARQSRQGEVGSINVLDAQIQVYILHVSFPLTKAGKE